MQFKAGVVAAGYSTEALALFARFTTPPTTARKTIINTAIVALKAVGIWSKLDGLWVLAAETRQAALQNWVQNLYNLQEIDGGNLTFTANVGFQGNGTSSSLGPAFNPATAVAPHYTQDDGSFGFWSQTAGQSDLIDMGNANSLIQCRSTANVTNHRVNASFSGSITNVGDGSGLFISSRTGSSATANVLYRDGVALPINSNPDISQAVNSSNFRILGRGGVTPTYSARLCSLAFIGSGMTAQNVTDFYAIFS